jgi:hypothetical protein
MNWIEEADQLKQQLASMLSTITAKTPFEQWFEELSTLSKRARDLYFERYWPTLLNTTDEKAKAEYQYLVKNVLPADVTPKLVAVRFEVFAMIPFIA